MAAFIVTGGFGVLGRAVGRAALAAGHDVVLVDIARTVPQDMAGESWICSAGLDLSDEPATQAAFEDIKVRHGGIAALANVAGGFVWSPAEQAATDMWQRMFAMNVLTTLSASRAALPALRESRGSIVNVGAHGAQRASAGMAPYAAAKSGVHRLTEALAEETRGTGVRVNAVLPSIIDTPANRRDMPDADVSAWVKPDDLAKIIIFLASDDARAINGVLLPVTL